MKSRISKNICMKCCGDCFSEEDWSHMIVTCRDLKFKPGYQPLLHGPNEPIHKKWLTYRGIPKWCPMQLEHIMDLQEVITE